jgi:methanogenic corrinoid protein MtbC1
LGVHAEHHYTESVRQVVQRGLFHLPPPHHLPRVLLTTPPGEIHGLGLLALHAALTLQGADCINLGTQTPETSVAQAVQDLGATVVAISVSVCFVPEALQRYVEALRQQLPPHCALWLGGEGSQCLVSDAGAGLHVFQTTSQAVQAWQKRHEDLTFCS